MEISTAIALAVVLLIALLDSVLHLVHPSRESARTHLVHMVEAPRSLRHWSGHRWGSDRLDPAQTMREGLITDRERQVCRTEAAADGQSDDSPSCSPANRPILPSRPFISNFGPAPFMMTAKISPSVDPRSHFSFGEVRTASSSPSA